MNIKLLLLLFSTACLSSCLSHKELLNFTEGQQFPETAAAGGGVLKLQVNDLLDIRVFNSNDLDPNTVLPYNLNQRTYETTNQSNTTMYRVDDQGMIAFPGLGMVPAHGLTLSELRDTLTDRLKLYLKAPIVNIRMVNFRITVLGEVRSPNSFTVEGNHLNVLEALGLAGDLTNYGRRDHVLIIREINGKRSYGYINLKSKDAFSSPFFELQQNDIVYVEPLKQKTGSVSDQSSKILPWVSISSVVLNIILFLFK